MYEFVFVYDILGQMSIFRLYRMREMLTILTDVRGVCLSVCLSRGLNRRRRGTIRRVPCAHGHSVQPLSNYFDHLFIVVHIRIMAGHMILILYCREGCNCIFFPSNVCSPK